MKKGIVISYTPLVFDSLSKGMELFPFTPSNRQVNTRKGINDPPSYSITLLSNPITFPITFLYGLVNVPLIL